jgi:phytoene synthase
VSQPLLGHIRLQWWRETLDGIYSGILRKHEVAEALAETVRVHALPREMLDALIDAREYDLDDKPFADLSALVTYGDVTVGHVQRLALRIAGAGDAYDALARDAGIAYALSGLARAIPFWASRAREIMPQDGTPLSTIVTVARDHYAEARRVRVPRRFLSALLPLSVAPLSLEIQSRAGFDPETAQPSITRFARQRAMLAAYLRGRL